MTRRQTRSARADALPDRLPDVPRDVVERMQDHLRREDFPQRGVVAAMNDFYARLDAAGLPPGGVTTDIYDAVATSRSRLRTLLSALRTFAPDVPLAAAAPVTRKWDAWLNARYNAKPKKAKRTRRVGMPPERWPSAWPRPEAILDRTVRPYGKALRPLAAKTRGAVVSAVGMLAASREWANERGVAVPERPSSELFEAFERYLLLERGVSCRSAANYFERTGMFFLRAKLLDRESLAALDEIRGALEEAATDEVPAKRTKLRAYRARFELGDILRAAVAAVEEARTLPAQSTAALRLRQKAVAYALLVNAGDRQGDLRQARIGLDLTRDADGTWRHDLRQAKTGTRKMMEVLWPGTCMLLDAHVLADRPVSRIESRMRELDGANLLTLEGADLGRCFINRRLEKDFPLRMEDKSIEHLTGHLIRTLIVDAIRRLRPDAVWAARHMMGHSDRWMHETYRSDFDESAAVQALDGLYAEIEAGRA